MANESAEDDLRGFNSVHAMMRLASALNAHQHVTPYGKQTAKKDDQDQPRVFVVPSAMEVASGAGVRPL